MSYWCWNDAVCLLSYCTFCNNYEIICWSCKLWQILYKLLMMCENWCNFSAGFWVVCERACVFTMNNRYLIFFQSKFMNFLVYILISLLIFLLIHSSELREHLIKVYDTRHVRRNDKKILITWWTNNYGNKYWRVHLQKMRVYFEIS